MATPRTRKEFEAELIARAWKDAEFKKRLLSDPRGVLDEELKKLGAPPVKKDLEFKVLEEDASHLYLVLPQNPAALSSYELTDEQVEAVAGGTIAIFIAVVSNVAETVVNVHSQIHNV